MIKPREINIKSDCGHYVISARLYPDSVSLWGSYWEAIIRKDGKRVNMIQVMRDTLDCYSLDGVCAHGIKLSKNTILYLAHITGIFTNELKDVDTRKVARQYSNEYYQARIQDGTL